jgi:hypothetical protein
MSSFEQYGCIYQTIDLQQFEEEENEIHFIKKTKGLEQMLKKVKHIDYFTNNEIKILNTLTYNHSIASNVYAGQGCTKFLNTFSSFSPVKQTKYPAKPKGSKGRNAETTDAPNNNSYGLFYYDLKRAKCKPLSSQIPFSTCARDFYLLLINTFKHSLNCLAYLKHSDLIHLGMSNDSITVSDDNYEVFIGDVGLMQFSNELFTLDGKLISIVIHSIDRLAEKEEKDRVFVYPVEIMMLVFMHMNGLSSISSHNVDTIVSSFLKQNPLLVNISETFYQTHCTSVLQQYINIPKSTILENMLKEKIGQTWNLFSLSMIYLNILMNIRNPNIIKSGFFNKWFKLLVLNTHPDYKKRKTIEDNMTLFSKLCYNNTLSEFTYSLNNL